MIPSCSRLIDLKQTGCTNTGYDLRAGPKSALSLIRPFKLQWAQGYWTCGCGWPSVLTLAVYAYLQLGTKHIATPGGATSNRLDRPRTVKSLTGGAAWRCHVYFVPRWIYFCTGLKPHHIQKKTYCISLMNMQYCQNDVWKILLAL